MGRASFLFVPFNLLGEKNEGTILRKSKAFKKTRLFCT